MDINNGIEETQRSKRRIGELSKSEIIMDRVLNQRISQLRGFGVAVSQVKRSAADDGRPKGRIKKFFRNFFKL